ncbi:hypothetical protein N185_15195 [Sinorhizobium sp. GW3]|nr:hypothetical protein N185_15195 [Sinorhizobium sp. GW3]
METDTATAGALNRADHDAKLKAIAASRCRNSI